MLTVLDALPQGLLQLPATRLHEILPGPTLIHLPGRHTAPLFVSVLLHGNEDVGWRALQQVLAAYADSELPRALSLFIGNVAAARAGARHLPDQPDYNRIWPGGEQGEGGAGAIMREVVERMRQCSVFASVDLHNNTGINPHYACVNRLDHAFLRLASLFSRTVVYFLRPTGVQSMAFAELCPAVTLECGKVGDELGVAHAAEFVEACLRLTEIPAHAVAAGDVDLYHTVATVKIAADVEFSLGATAAPLRLVDDMDHLNFRELAPGTVLATLTPPAQGGLRVWDEQGRDVTERFLQRDGVVIRLRRAVMPSMFTLNKEVIRQDCLGYFMERYPLPAAL